MELVYYIYFILLGEMGTYIWRKFALWHLKMHVTAYKRVIYNDEWPIHDIFICKIFRIYNCQNIQRLSYSLILTLVSICVFTFCILQFCRKKLRWNLHSCYLMYRNFSFQLAQWLIKSHKRNILLDNLTNYVNATKYSAVALQMYVFFSELSNWPPMQYTSYYSTCSNATFVTYNAICSVLFHTVFSYFNIA